MRDVMAGAAADVAKRSAAIREAGIELKQHPDEITFAYQHVEVAVGIVDTFIEVGSYEGASLYVYAGLVKRKSLLGRGGLVIAVEDGRRGPKKRERLKRAMAMIEAEGIEVKWVRGNSHIPATLEAVRDALGTRKVGFLHIDGDHSAEGSMADWKMYGPLVRPGGITAFHDIRATPPSNVTQTWETICNDGSLTRAICKGRFQTREGGKLHKPCGIGLVYC